jgi:hypothetical protein
MLSTLFGIVSMTAGLWGMWIWRHEFVFFLKGFLPVSFVFAGLVAIIVGISSLKDRE